MPQARNAVTVNRSVEDVFAFVADGENAPKWRSGVVDVARTAGTGGLGTTYRQGVRGPMGRRIAADYEITAYEPGRRIEFPTTAGPVRPHGRFDMEPQSGATRLTFALDAELTGIRRLLMGSMVARTMADEVAALDRLKAVLEAGAT